MNRLEELIEKLCPDGVEYKKLGFLCEITKGIQFNKADMNDEGTYPVINGGINPSGYIEQYNQDENTITISQGGASAGFVNWLTVKFWAGAHCYIVKPSDTILNRYTYHFIKSQEYKLQECQYGAGIPALAKSTVEALKIPVPPLEVQSEIVRILDNFTELTARKKQYEYYRDSLFIFNENVEQKKLSELCSLITKQTGFDYSATIKPSLINEKQKNSYSFIQNKNFSGTYIDLNTDFYIPISVAQRFPKITLDCPSILISLSGKVGNVGFYDFEEKAFIGGAVGICKLKNNINGKYILYYLESKVGQKFLLGSVKAGSHLNITVESIRNAPIPLPTIETQNTIVNILDNFSKLCNDISEGLPAEIEARQKQYEYYRDKLLSFKSLSLNS